MKSRQIKISDIKDIQQFVNLALCIDGDVLVRKGKFVVDGKSIMGVISIDSSTGISVEYEMNCESAITFDCFLDKFAI